MPHIQTGSFVQHWERLVYLDWIAPPNYVKAPVAALRGRWAKASKRAKSGVLAGWSFATELYAHAMKLPDAASRRPLLDEASAVLDELLKRRPERLQESQLHHDRACIELASQQLSAMLRSLKEANRLVPEGSQATERLGAMLLLADQPSAQKLWANRTNLPSQIESALVAIALAKHALQLGDTATAIKALKVALRKWTRGGSGELVLALLKEVVVLGPEEGLSLTRLFVANPAFLDNTWSNEISSKRDVWVQLDAIMEAVASPTELATWRAEREPSNLERPEASLPRVFVDPEALVVAEPKTLDDALFAHYVFQSTGQEVWLRAATALYAHVAADANVPERRLRVLRERLAREALVAKPGGMARSEWLRFDWERVLQACSSALPSSSRPLTLTRSHAAGPSLASVELQLEVRLDKDLPSPVVEALWIRPSRRSRFDSGSEIAESVGTGLAHCIADVLARRRLAAAFDRPATIRGTLKYSVIDRPDFDPGL